MHINITSFSGFSGLFGVSERFVLHTGKVRQGIYLSLATVPKGWHVPASAVAPVQLLTKETITLVLVALIVKPRRDAPWTAYFRLNLQ